MEIWSQFRERVFGSEFDIWHDGGVNYTAAWALKQENPAHVRAMLLEGLAKQDYVAILGLQLVEWSDLVELLTPCLELSHGTGKFRVELAQLLQAKAAGQDLEGGGRDYSQYVLSELENPSSDLRLYAAVALRNFPAESVMEGLLRHIAMDGAFLVRINAFESVVKLKGQQASTMPQYEEWSGMLGDSRGPEDWAKVAEGVRGFSF